MGRDGGRQEQECAGWRDRTAPAAWPALGARNASTTRESNCVPLPRVRILDTILWTSGLREGSYAVFRDWLARVHGEETQGGAS